MEQIKILCYGDSNTWGYISGSNHQRYGNDERWTKILAKLLGNNFEISVNEYNNLRSTIGLGYERYRCSAKCNKK